MHVQIFNRDTNPSNLMADGIVDLSKVLRETEHDGYFPLLFRGRPGGGDLYLELTFYQSVSGWFYFYLNEILIQELLRKKSQLDLNSK